VSASQQNGFSFSEVVEILMELYGVHEKKRATFIARLQQLQRLGLPAGTNTGRGVKVRYLNWQLADLVLFLDLLDCGVPPNFLAEQFSPSGGYFCLGGAGLAAQNADPASEAAEYLLVTFRALAYFRSADPNRRRPDRSDHVLKGCRAPLVAKRVSERPTVAINLSKRLLDLRVADEKIMPERVGDATFYPTRSGLKEAT
jgi:hypothetical protein